MAAQDDRDELVISTAVSQITTDFHSTSDRGWYATAYLLTNCAFLLVFGKMCTVLRVKHTFLAATLCVETGSAMCGAAPDSLVSIVGRAAAGLGAGGVQSGVASRHSPTSLRSFARPRRRISLRRAGCAALEQSTAMFKPGLTRGGTSSLQGRPAAAPPEAQ
ncbi:major facilitator superfamily transporter aflatoxin efflux [Moelleriella libera RCEF 2490]|uniref:Major facilitator superfamily transporter aflatoxin efflux n=1 Tax=Moelleriella libera RCEF 2490 TaxID=1081109 RepID=A0A166VLU9_9HYPO|nr:major facilitator superfamily transporter aflatoxin efflux [Moelleriella libera RCEF 2490]